MIVTDLHAGPVAGTKIGPHAVSLLDTILNHGSTFDPDLIVDLGDRITSTSKRRDEENTKRIADVFSSTRIPREHLPGNHDVKRLSLEESSDHLGSELDNRVRKFGKYNFVFWAPQINAQKLTYGPEELEWLADAVCAPNSVVFTHFPFLDAAGSDADLPRSDYLIRAEAHNATDAVEVITQAGTVRGVITGHVHGNSLNYAGGIPFITLQSVTEAITGTRRPIGAWALIDMADTFTMQVFGLDPLTVTF